MKYIIELEEPPFRARQYHTWQDEELWRVKGLPHIVLSSEDISKLTPLEGADEALHT